MVTKKLKDNDTGKVYTINFENEPTQEDMADAFDSVKSRPATTPPDGGTTPENKYVQRGGALNEITGNISAGIHGLAEGATFGLAGKMMSPEEKAREAELKKNFPTAYGVGDIASYATGLPKLVGKGIIKAGTKLAPKLAKGITGQAAEAAAIGATTEGIKSTVGGAEEDVSLARGAEQAKTGAIGGGVFGGAIGVAGKALPVLAKTSGKLADNIVRTVLRPGKKGEVEGFIPENMIKHNLLASDIDEMAAKTKGKLTDLRGQLEAIEQVGTTKGVQVNINDAIKNAKKELIDNNVINFHDRQKAADLLTELEKDAWKVSDSGKMKLSEAMSYKTDTGAKGYWNKGASQARTSEDADWKEKVYNTVYRNVKNAINTEVERADIGDIKTINKLFEEVIPISNAISRRAGTLKGNMGISPLELILGGGGLAAAGIGAATGGKEGGALGALGGIATVAAARGQRSPLVAKKLYGVAEKLKGVSPTISSIYRPSEAIESALPRLGKKIKSN